MSKSTTTNLSSELQQKQNGLSSLQQNLSGLQSGLYSAQSSADIMVSHSSQLQSAQTSLTSQLQIQANIFGALTHLLDQYRESKGIVLDPRIVFTQTISAEELASTDILREACKDNYKEGFDLALERIINIDFQDSSGKTVLMHALINGFYYGVDQLLQRGASVDLVDRQGVNALIYSAQIPHIKYTKQIAENTRDISLKNEVLGGGNALHLLLLNGNKIIFASELNGELRGTVNQNSLLVVDEDYTFSGDWIGNIQISGNYTLTINSGNVTLGSSSSNISSVHEKTLRLTKFFIEQLKININEQDRGGNTALFLASKSMLFDVADLLFNSYSAADLPNKQSLTAWDIALYNSLQPLIDIFIHKKHINPEAVKLWIAARKGDASIVDQQIKKGLHPDSTVGDYNETTPLIQAIISDSMPTVSIIVNNGASVNQPSKDLASPLYYSLGYGGQPIEPTIVKFLVSKGADVSQPMDDGDTPMHMASYKACIGGMKLLLVQGANVDSTNNQGKTALHALIEKKDLNTEQKLTAVKYLLCKSASPILKDAEGHDAVYLAQSSFPEALPFVEHPETLPDIGSFEASIIGELSSWS